MLFTHTYQKWCSAPTHFLVNTGFTASPHKTICFDQLIKAYIPTPRCLHQSIDGSLELAYFVSTFRIDKTFWLHHIQLFFKKSIKECRFDIHLQNFIKCGNCSHDSDRLLSIDTSEKISLYSTPWTCQKTFHNKSSFVDSNTTISVRLPLEDPFI